MSACIHPWYCSATSPHGPLVWVLDCQIASPVIVVQGAECACVHVQWAPQRERAAGLDWLLPYLFALALALPCTSTYLPISCFFLPHTLFFDNPAFFLCAQGRIRAPLHFTFSPQIVDLETLHNILLVNFNPVRPFVIILLHFPSFQLNPPPRSVLSHR